MTTASPLPTYPDDQTYKFDPVQARRLILASAFERGRIGNTFATADELRTPGYDAAYTIGHDLANGRLVVEPHMAYGCGCPSCRFEKIVKGGAQ